MPPTGMTTRAWVLITPSASKVPMVAAAAAAIAAVATGSACGRPRARRAATCPAISTMIASQPAAPARPACWKTISKMAPTAAS